MRVPLPALVAMTVLSVSAGVGWAQIGIDNGPPDVVGFSASDFSSSAVAPFGQSGDEFVLPVTATITDIQWWGVHFPENTAPATDQFTVRVFAVDDTGPSVDPLISFDATTVQRVDTGEDMGDFDLYEYHLAGLDAPMSPGNYLLSVVNDTSTLPATEWHWATSSDLDGFARVRPADGASWSLASNELAFRISGLANEQPFSLMARSVPEPGSAATLWLWLTAGGLWRRDRRRV